MNLEIGWKNTLYYIEAGNYYQGCMKVMKEFMEDCPDGEVPIENFNVTNLDNMDNCEIALDLIVALQYESNNYSPYDTEPELNPDCDILRAAQV